MIKSSAIALGATAVGPTGGTSTTTTSLGDSLEKHRIFIPEGGVDTRTRKSIDFMVKPEVISASSPSGYTQKRNTVLLRVPIPLASGDITVCTARIELGIDIEMTTAVLDEMRFLAAQLISDSDYDDFWTQQSLA